MRVPAGQRYPSYLAIPPGHSSPHVSNRRFSPDRKGWNCIFFASGLCPRGKQAYSCVAMLTLVRFRISAFVPLCGGCYLRISRPRLQPRSHKPARKRNRSSPTHLRAPMNRRPSPRPQRRRASRDRQPAPRSSRRQRSRPGTCSKAHAPRTRPRVAQSGFACWD